MSSLPTDDLLALDNQLCFALYAATRRVMRAYQPALQSMDLTYPQYLVMLVLWEWGLQHESRPTVTALGQRLDLDSGTLTPVLRRLEQKGLVARERSPEDGRELFVRATPAGKALKRRARRVPTDLCEHPPIPLKQMVALRDQLRQLRAALPWATASESA